MGDVGDPTRQLGGLRRGLGAEDGVKVHGEGRLWMERERRIQIELCRIEVMRQITYFPNRPAQKQKEEDSFHLCFQQLRATDAGGRLLLVPVAATTGTILL